ncbi:hypothetical protein WJU23_23010 [Prosthecobacter sp. SYSU 5D2]|uniref:hypothetical protein n=1 Tax=Prosthecobacter sp. SYSU 5D2 TaxID=3134134 RepID=UPI0031FEBD2B
MNMPLLRTFLLGMACMGGMIHPAFANEPKKSRLIIIEGPRPEVRRYLPAHPRPEPQGYSSGLLSPARKPVVQKDGDKQKGPTRPESTQDRRREQRQPKGKSVAATDQATQPQSIQPTVPSKQPSLLAKWVRPGFVKSPYPPYAVLNVEGLPSGSLAKDPVNGKIFRVP